MIGDPAKRVCREIYSVPKRSIGKLLFGLAIVAGTFMLCPGFAHAKNCTVQTNDVVFGNYDVFSSTDLTSRGRVRVDCNARGVSVEISLSPGGSGSYNPRKMTGPGGDQINYRLYTAANYATIWGDGSSSTTTVTGTTNRRGRFNPRIYGQIPSGQDASVGSYTDSLVVTVTF